MHDRLEEYISEESCAEEIESFTAHGQREPVQGRLVRDDPDYDIEVYCGARRLFVAQLLKVPLIVEIREISDKGAIVAMHISNNLRRRLSPYERGLAYLAWLRSNQFKSQDEMAAILKVAPAKLSRLLKLARLPSVIINAFKTPVDIRESWGLKLTEILEDSVRKDPAIRAARAFAANPSSRPPPEMIYQRLLASAAPTKAGHHKLVAGCRDKVIEGEDGAPLFRIRYQRDEIALLLPIDRTSTRTLDQIQRAVQSILATSEPRMIPMSASTVRPATG